MRVVVIDVGNTSTGIALWANGKISRVSHINGGILREPDACSAAVRKAGAGGVDGAILGSVVPRVNTLWQWLVESALGHPLLLVSPTLPLDVTIDYPQPDKLGADRLADACGGVCRYGAPIIVADFGTALTFDCVTSDRRYIGGVIAPGLPLMVDYLEERTAQLPRLKLTGKCPAMGRSSMQAMRIGAQVGYRGIVREIVHYVRQSMNAPDARLIATGGYAGWALNGSGMDFVIDPTLTLFGLGRIFERTAQRNGNGGEARK
ncbi:MAG: type III pantothenate kinase [Kiritimatiellae bacterium]|nr:type III pantothenate kinase [Kiritimatiellia bacterium]